ncbi:MAG: MBL fold metallo-hydrolase [Bacteroidales bacterium]|mgnify:CR=1 FL=1|nr:MBL fold metallo-hydrolase [Bacteroidales bacterium]
MKLKILGSGTSTGVPQIGCTCEVCTSEDSKDKRLRCSSLLDVRDKRILFDCGPDFRAQMLGVDFKPLDAVLITHEHYDHVGGLDDLRPFSVFGDVNVYAERFCGDHLMKRIPYCFTPKEKRYPGVPAINLLEIEPHVPFKVGDVEIMPVRVMHGRLPVVGFRIENFAYITDMKTIPEEDVEYLRGVEYMVINGLRHEEHPSHQTIDHAISFAESLGVKEIWLIHMGHHIKPHAQEEKNLPEWVHLAYDGEEIAFE